MVGLKDKERFVFFKYVPPKAKASLDSEESDNLTEVPAPAEPTLTPAADSEGTGDLLAGGESEALENSQEEEAESAADEETTDESYPEVPECPEEPEIPEEPEGPCPDNAIVHVIQDGDTFWKLAKKYGTTVEEISDANPDVDPLNLQIGETLCIPVELPGAKG